MAANFWQSSHCEQWILDKQELLRMRGEDLKYLTEEEYNKLLLFFCVFIHAIGTDQQQAQKVRVQVIATACVYFRRFYARRSLKDIDPFLLAPTSLFLASKVEEHGMMSHNKLIHATHNALKRWPFLPQDMILRAQNIQEAEFFLLEIMDCCLIVYHPYRPLNLLISDMTRDAKDTKEFDQIAATAWRILNDCTRTDLSLLYPPHQIAIAAIFVASMWLNKDLKNWFAELAVDYEKIFEIQKIIVNFYTLWRSFNEREQLLNIIQKVPRPSSGPQSVSNTLIHSHSHGNMNVTSLGMHQGMNMGPPQLPGANIKFESH